MDELPHQARGGVSVRLQRAARPPSVRGERGRCAGALAVHDEAHERARAQQERHRGSSHRLLVGAAVHRRLSPRRALVLRKQRLDPIRQRLIERHLARDRLVVEARHRPHEQFEQPVELHAQRIERKADALRVRPRLALRRNERRQERRAFGRGEHHGRAAQAPRLHECLLPVQPASSLRQAGARLNKAVPHAPGGVFCIPHAPASSAASSMPYARSR